MTRLHRPFFPPLFIILMTPMSDPFPSSSCTHDTPLDALAPCPPSSLWNQFLSVPHYRYIFFVDADVEWAPAMMDRFIHSGHDFLSAMYPKKQLDW